MYLCILLYTLPQLDSDVSLFMHFPVNLTYESKNTQTNITNAGRSAYYGRPCVALSG